MNFDFTQQHIHVPLLCTCAAVGFECDVLGLLSKVIAAGKAIGCVLLLGSNESRFCVDRGNGCVLLLG